MNARSSSKKIKQFQVRTFSNDEALIQNRRDHIVRFCVKAFIKKGYHRTNMREISQVCRMSAGALYHYFGSKEEILYSILYKSTFEQAEHFEILAQELKNLNPTDGLRQLIREFCQWHNDNQDMTVFAYQETRNLPISARQDIFDSEIRILTVFEDILRRGRDSGEFQIKDPKLFAHNIQIIGHAWALRRWFLKKHCTWETYTEIQTEILLKTLLSSGQ